MIPALPAVGRDDEIHGRVAASTAAAIRSAVATLCTDRAAFAVDPPASLTTASVTTDFAGAARVGDWLEAHVEVQKVGGRLAFANAWLVVDGQRIARASAVFARNSGPRPEAAGQSGAGSVATEVAAR